MVRVARLLLASRTPTLPPTPPAAIRGRRATYACPSGAVGVDVPSPPRFPDRRKIRAPRVRCQTLGPPGWLLAAPASPRRLLGAPPHGLELRGDNLGAAGLEPLEQVVDGRFRDGVTDLELLDDPGLDPDRVAVGLPACVVQIEPVIHGRSWWAGSGRGVPGQYDSRAKRQGSAPSPATAP